MSTQNNTTRPPGRQSLPKAFEAAFCPYNDDNPITPAQALESFHDLQAHGDTTAAALAIGDCILSLKPHERAAEVDLLTWLIDGRK